jgi:hypothetical protein
MLKTRLNTSSLVAEKIHDKNYLKTLGSVVNLLISAMVSSHSFFCTSCPAGDVMYGALLSDRLATKVMESVVA